MTRSARLGVGRTLAATVAAVVCIAIAVAPVADAGHAAKRCGTITAAKKRIGVFAVNVGCRFAKRWTRRYLVRKQSPRRYRCTRIDQPGVKLVLSCKRSRSRYFYAERR